MSKDKSSRSARASLGTDQLIRFIGGVIATSAAVLYVIIFGEHYGKFWLGIASIVQVVVPVCLALMVTPTLDQESNRTNAVLGVDELLRLRKSQKHLQSILEEGVRDRSSELGYTYLRALEILRSQTEYVDSNVALWANIHPDAADEVFERRETISQILEDLESKREGNE